MCFLSHPDVVLTYHFPAELSDETQITNVLGIAPCIVVKYTKLERRLLLRGPTVVGFDSGVVIDLIRRQVYS
jgi:hypothetical protein